MLRKKIGVLGAAAVLTASLLAGCGTEGQQAAAENTAKTVQVTEIDGTTITAAVGEFSSDVPDMSGEAPPERPDGAKPDRGTPPELPDGTKPDESTPPDSTKPDGEASPDGAKPDGSTPPELSDGTKPDGEALPDDINSDGASHAEKRGGKFFTASGESVTFTITDTTQITWESPQGSEEALAEDIVADSVLEITVDAKNQASKVVIKRMPRPKRGEASQVEQNER